MTPFGGIFTPIATPFRDDDTIDEAGLRRNVARWMDTPLHGLVVLGSSGEAPQLDDEEADRVVDLVREGVPVGRPLIAGTGRESTRATIAATRRAAAAGVDAVLVRTPAFFKPQMGVDAFVRHYTDVADAAPVPVLLYNVSAYTGVNLPPEAVERLAAHANIVGIKESGGDIGQIAEFLGRTPDDFTVLAGSATTFVHALCAGCHGGVLALAGILPEACVRLQALVSEGRLDAARALQRQLLPLARSVGSAHGVAGLKAALDLLGYVGGAPRSPLCPVAADTRERIRSQLAALGAPLAGGVPALH
jgi:4-hydroxy-2-oxoglutarate aldolase